MKKVICLLLIIMLLPLSVFADGESAADMQNALVIVKEKITVPAELIEFSGDTLTYNGKTSYNFEWSTPNYSKSISVSCDSHGRINSYYENTFEMSDKKLSAISKNEIVSYGEKFLRKLTPEAFENENDRLFYDEKSYDARGNLRYYIEFARYRNSVLVKDNYASMTLCVADEKIYVRNVNINFNYDVQFYPDEKEIENYAQKYTEKFPVELIYRDEYNLYAKGNENRTTPILVYRIKDDNAGYIDICTGDIIVEDLPDDEFRKEFSQTEDSVVMGTMNGGGSSLTPQEIAEIGKIEGLVSVEEIENKLKKLPYLNFDTELTMKSSNLNKDSDGKYFYRLNYSVENEKNYRYFNVTVNAENAEVLSITNNIQMTDDKNVELTENDVKSAQKKTEEFLSVIAKDKLSQTQEESSDIYSKYVNKSFVRMVNGIKYVDNGISVSFDAKNNLVRSFSINFTDGEFSDPNKAIGEDEAYRKITEYSPIIPIYIYSGGNYKKAATLKKRNVAVDALSGEVKNSYENGEYVYSDIDGHWVCEAAEKLAEVQIGLKGGMLEPDKGITQESFLKLMCIGILGKHYQDYDQKELYDALLKEGFIKDEEKNPSVLMKREDGFVYIIRLAGLEKVAVLTDIFKVNYQDAESISKEKTGYAAILSGMGIICGDGGLLRAQDTLTNAEAVTILYRYMLSC